MKPIRITGLKQNNLKNISVEIPKNRIVVFTGVSGSGKSSIVFDTIAAESQRQMNETYSAWVRGRLPKYHKPDVERIENLNPSVIIDQSRLGGNARSTVGTISDMYSLLRLLFSRIGNPHVGSASSFSINIPEGMCPTCSGIGKILDLDMTRLIDPDKTFDEGCFLLPAFKKNNYYWKVYRHPEHFRVDVPWKDLREEEPEQLEEDEPLEEIDISAGDHSPSPKRPGFFAALFGAIAGVNMARGSNQQQHNGRCNGDCAHCPPHYGYRYGRWYYGHNHVHGCEFGGNKGNGSMD